MKVNKSVSFDTVEDKRLLREIDALPWGEFSKTVRVALLSYFGLESGVTLGMLYSKMVNIERKLDNGVVVAGQGQTGAAETGDELGADIIGAFD